MKTDTERRANKVQQCLERCPERAESVESEKQPSSAQSKLSDVLQTQDCSFTQLHLCFVCVWSVLSMLFVEECIIVKSSEIRIHSAVPEEVHPSFL